MQSYPKLNYNLFPHTGHPQKVADSDLVKGRLDKTKIVPPLAKKSKLILYVEYDSTSTADKCQLDIDFEMSDPSKLSDNQLFQARFIIRPENNYLTLVQSSKVDGKWKKWKGKGLKGMKSGKHQLQIYVGAEFFTVEIYGNGLQTEFPSKVSTDLISGFTAIKFSSKHPSCFRPIPDSIEILHEEAIEGQYQISRSNISISLRALCLPLEHRSIGGILTV